MSQSTSMPVNGVNSSFISLVMMRPGEVFSDTTLTLVPLNLLPTSFRNCCWGFRLVDAVTGAAVAGGAGRAGAQPLRKKGLLKPKPAMPARRMKSRRLIVPRRSLSAILATYSLCWRSCSFMVERLLRAILLSRGHRRQSQDLLPSGSVSVSRNRTMDRRIGGGGGGGGGGALAFRAAPFAVAVCS